MTAEQFLDKQNIEDGAYIWDGNWYYRRSDHVVRLLKAYAVAQLAEKELEIEDLQTKCRDMAVALGNQIARAEAAEAELEQRWIAVGERLPEPGECLTYAPLPHSGNQHYDWIRVRKYFDGEFHFYDKEDCEWIAIEVTHWQPLPSPPKEAKS